MASADTPPTPKTHKKKRILSGMRPTGKMHLGNYYGALYNWLRLQEEYQCFYFVADWHALTTEYDAPREIGGYIKEMVLDWLSVGLDPKKSTIFVQSAIPEHAELYLIFGMFTPVPRLERNPTIKDEIQARGFGRDIPAGFLCYPAAQAADITAFKATVVPVGEDQAPLIEQTNEIVRRINRQTGRDVLLEAQALIPRTGRLPGIDGKSKMSKSQGNAIPLTAPPDAISEAVKRMYTDPGHLRASDPGKIEGNVVFTYLDAFDEDQAAVAALKEHYQRGGLGDAAVKRRLNDVLQALLAPIRERRAAIARDPGYVLEILRTGTAAAREITQATLSEVRDALGLFHLS